MITAHKNNHIKRIPADKKLNIALDAIRRQETVVDISKRYNCSIVHHDFFNQLKISV